MAITQVNNNCGLYPLGFDGTNLNTTLYTAVIVGAAPEGLAGTEGAALLKPDGQAPIFGVLQNYGPQGEPTEVARAGISPVLISTDAAGGKVGQKLSAKTDGTFTEASGSTYDVIALCDYQGGQQVTADIGR